MDGRNGHTVWVWKDNWAYTGHMHGRRLVDTKRAQMVVYYTDDGQLIVGFKPKKGVSIPDLLLPATIMETHTPWFGCPVVKSVSFCFDDQADEEITMTLPRRHRISAEFTQ